MDNVLREALESVLEQEFILIRRNFEAKLAKIIVQPSPSDEPVQRQLRELFAKLEEAIRSALGSFLRDVMAQTEGVHEEATKLREVFRKQLQSFTDEGCAIVVSGAIADAMTENLDPDNSLKH